MALLLSIYIFTSLCIYSAYHRFIIANKINKLIPSKVKIFSFTLVYYSIREVHFISLSSDFKNRLTAC